MSKARSFRARGFGQTRGSARCAGVCGVSLSRRRSTLMLRRILIASAAAAMLLVTFTPDDAEARGRGGGAYRAGGGGYRGGAVAVRGARGGAVAVRGGRYGYRGGAYRATDIRLRCRCGSGRRCCGRSSRGRGLPRQLLRRLRQLRLRRRVQSVLAAVRYSKPWRGYLHRRTFHNRTGRPAPARRPP